MREYTQRFHIDVPPEAAFADVVDPANQQSRFMKIEVVNETSDPAKTTFRYFYRVLGIKFGGGEYSYSEYVPGQRFTWQFPVNGFEMWLIGGPVASTFTFEAADGGTDLTIRPQFKTPIPGLNHLARAIMWRSWQRSMRTFVSDIEKRATQRVHA